MQLLGVLIMGFILTLPYGFESAVLALSLHEIIVENCTLILAYCKSFCICFCLFLTTLKICLLRAPFCGN